MQGIIDKKIDDDRVEKVIKRFKKAHTCAKQYLKLDVQTKASGSSPPKISKTPSSAKPAAEALESSPPKISETPVTTSTKPAAQASEGRHKKARFKTCAAGDPCKTKGAPLTSFHRCLKCKKKMHGTLCAGLDNEEGAMGCLKCFPTKLVEAKAIYTRSNPLRSGYSLRKKIKMTSPDKLKALSSGSSNTKKQGSKTSDNDCKKSAQKPTSATSKLLTAYLRMFADPKRRNDVTGLTVFCNDEIEEDNMDQPTLAERYRDWTNLLDADENEPFDANATRGEYKAQLDNAFQEAKRMLVERAINSKLHR